MKHNIQKNANKNKFKLLKIKQINFNLMTLGYSYEWQ